MLRSAGFSVHKAERSDVCSASDIAEDITNIHFEGKYENTGEHDDISEREGHLGCVLRRNRGSRRDPVRIDTDAPAASPIFSGRKATFSFANLECTLYPDGDDPESQIERLRLAFERLADA